MSSATGSGSSVSSTTTASGGSVSGRQQQLPNRFTAAFQKMKVTCPNHISGYATCIMQAEASSGESISKDACAKEFALIKECFRQVRMLR